MKMKADKQVRKLGVIDIPSFYNNLSKDVKKEIEKLSQRKTLTALSLIYEVMAVAR